jgi:hypothetical protein
MLVQILCNTHKTRNGIKSSNATQNSCSNWGKHGVTQKPILGPLLFIIHINDLPLMMNTLSVPIILAYDTSVIISSKNIDDFCLLSNRALSHMSTWFTANKMALNLDKTNPSLYAINGFLEIAT